VQTTTATADKLVAQWQQQLQDVHATDLLAWAAETFRGQIAFASSMGAEDQVLTQMIAAAELDIPIFTIDTGRLFPEVYDLIASTEAKYGLRIEVFYPDSKELEAIVRENGIDLYYKSIALRQSCCEVRKIHPLQRALRGKTAWICGLRKTQAVTRGAVRNIEWDKANQLVKINPLCDWAAEDIWQFIKANNIACNPLHDKGFPSIGCACCTRAVTAGEDIRKGRWWWEEPNKKECGLHR